MAMAGVGVTMAGVGVTMAGMGVSMAVLTLCVSRWGCPTAGSASRQPHTHSGGGDSHTVLVTATHCGGSDSRTQWWW